MIQTFRMMLTNYLNIGLAVNLTSTDVLLNVLPLFYTAGINLYSSALFMVGGCVLVARHFEPEAAFQVLEARATVFFGVPAVYQELLEHPRFSGERLRSVRSWGCGGAALSLPVARRFVDAGIRVRTGMGMTETGPTVFLQDEDEVLTKAGSVGRPQLLTDVRIVDAAGHDVAQGETGKAFFCLAPDVTSIPDDRSLRQFCRQRLAAYKVPQSFEQLSALPRNALGKVTKQVLHHGRHSTDGANS